MFKKSDKKKTSGTVDVLNSEHAKFHRKELGAIPCGEVIPRHRAKVLGRISAIRIVPRGQSQWLEVVIKDDTGLVNGWFFGRDSIPGIIPGVNVLFDGVVQFDEGEMTIANPYYEFI